MTFLSDFRAICGLGPITPLTNHSTGPARKAAQAGEFKRVCRAWHVTMSVEHQGELFGLPPPVIRPPVGYVVAKLTRLLVRAGRLERIYATFIDNRPHILFVRVVSHHVLLSHIATEKFLKIKVLGCIGK